VPHNEQTLFFPEDRHPPGAGPRTTELMQEEAFAASGEKEALTIWWERATEHANGIRSRRWRTTRRPNGSLCKCLEHGRGAAASACARYSGARHGAARVLEMRLAAPGSRQATNQSRSALVQPKNRGQRLPGPIVVINNVASGYRCKKALERLCTGGIVADGVIG